MTDPRELVHRIRSELKPIDERILRHPYLGALEAGRVTRDGLKAFAGQQYHIISSDVRSVAAFLARHGHLPSRTFLGNTLQGELAAFDALLAFARALGVSEDELEAYEPSPGGQAYCLCLAWLGAYGSDAELAAAFLVNFPAWGANCRRMSAALKERYGFKAQELGFFDLFANVPPFEEEALVVIRQGMERGVPARRIQRAARLLQAYELMYWDAMAEAAQSGN